MARLTLVFEHDASTVSAHSEHVIANTAPSHTRAPSGPLFYDGVFAHAISLAMPARFIDGCPRPRAPDLQFWNLPVRSSCNVTPAPTAYRFFPHHGRARRAAAMVGTLRVAHLRPLACLAHPCPSAVSFTVDVDRAASQRPQCGGERVARSPFAAPVTAIVDSAYPTPPLRSQPRLLLAAPRSVVDRTLIGARTRCCATS
ncbi:hypothetical protein EXIGLDRAFT_762195 [Exidia glandulosa HHB12029]|uniref:Uncharacterized protein n=1 Tax=Exidia glandulosa HHB12029 TaxID=1314781 RepID=A0A165MXC6_EXIGL|nr:hypothetical protein EXIGLDRAFT_762195 [Exidia glandulosa HHB12029]